MSLFVLRPRRRQRPDLCLEINVGPLDRMDFPTARAREQSQLDRIRRIARRRLERPPARAEIVVGEHRRADPLGRVFRHPVAGIHGRVLAVDREVPELRDQRLHAVRLNRFAVGDDADPGARGYRIG